jgi:hypothetical protein
MCKMFAHNIGGVREHSEAAGTIPDNDCVQVCVSHHNMAVMGMR